MGISGFSWERAQNSSFSVRKVFLRDRTVFLVGVSKHGSQMRDKQELAPLANRVGADTNITREYIPTTN
jgi:hypothetical protein